jgi:hypothetical protein
MAWGLRENGTSPACSLFGSRQSPWCLDRKSQAVAFA